jgi:subtilisin family serine protease
VAVAVGSLAVLAVPALAGAEPTAETSAPPTPPATTVPGQIIVQWADGAGRHAKETVREDAEVTSQATLGDPSFQLVKTEPGQAVADAVAELEEAPAVVVAEPDTYAAPTAVPNDPLFPEQWALQNEGTGIEGFSGAVAGDDIGVLGAWNVTIGDPSVVVADIDTGYRFDSPDLGPVAWENPGEIPGNGIDDDHNGYVDDVHGWDFVGENAEAATEDNDPTDSNLISGGHGVHTAGIIGAAGDNGIGITGVAQDVRIMPLRVCANAPATNKALCPTSSLIAAIIYAGRNGAKVANISLTGTTRSVAELNALAENPDTLYVTAAGNDAQDNDINPHYPCNFDPDAETSIKGADENVVCVAATDQADQLASFSDWGDHNVDLGAPGTQILSTYPAEEKEVSDDFQAKDFSTRWRTAFGAEGGFELTEEAPLASLGISDSPGRTPTPNSIRGSQLMIAVGVSTEVGSCTLAGLDSVTLAGGSAKVTVVKNGFSLHTFALSETSGPGMSVFRTAPMTDLGGGNINLRFTYAAGPAPTAAAGMWIDNVKLTCVAPLSVPPTYGFLEGTSMAAPQVSGAAALLYSEDPSASTEEVGYALNEGADPVASLAGKTISGGRLDVTDALAWLAPSAPTLTIEPSSPSEDLNPRIRGTVAAGFRVQLYANGSCDGVPVASGTPAELASPGFAVHVVHGSQTEFTAQAETRYANSPCSAPITYVNTVEPPPLAPLLDHTDPASPSEEEAPRVVGSAPAGTTIKIYFGRTCSGFPTAIGSAAELAEPGIAVMTIEGRTFDYSATATDPVGNASPCSNFVTYRRLGADETAPEPIGDETPVGPAPVVPGTPSPSPSPSPLSSGCTVPKLLGKTLSQAKAALKHAGCKLGKAKVRIRKGARPGVPVVSGSSPVPGTVTTEKVSVRLTPKARNAARPKG